MIQKRCRVALFRGPNQPFEISERPINTPEPEGVLVQVTLATICGSDLHTVSGRRAAPTPSVLGHEAVGRVAAPTQARDVLGLPLREGDRVTWTIMASCGQCYYCRQRDLPQKCERLFKYGHARSEEPYHLNGGFAEYIYLRPGTTIYHLPDTVSDAEAVPLNCALATVMGGLDVIGVRSEDIAVVQGAGLLGIYTACLLKERSCKVVAVTDPIAERLRIASQFGATHTFKLSKDKSEQISEKLRALTNGRGVDLVVEVSGAPEALMDALNWLGVGGRCLTLGFVYPARIPLDIHQIVTKCLTLRGNHNYHPRDLGAAIRFVEEKRNHYPFANLVDAVYPLSKIDEAFKRAAQRDAVRIALNPE